MDFSKPPSMTRGLTNLTTGLRFGGAHISLAQSKSDPNTLYLGTRNGHINVSHDGGRVGLSPRRWCIAKSFWLDSIWRHHGRHSRPLVVAFASLYRTSYWRKVAESPNEFHGQFR